MQLKLHCTENGGIGNRLEAIRVQKSANRAVDQTVMGIIEIGCMVSMAFE